MSPRRSPARGARARSGGRAPRLGQHFLHDGTVIDRIRAAVPDDGLPILEVGPGGGVLSGPLSRLGRPYVAVELDETLAARVRRLIVGASGVGVINADILDLDAREALAEVGAAPPYGLVGNLPYAITQPLFRKFLSADPDPPRWMVVMVQWEVGRQAVAPAGKRSLLSVSVQYYADAELLFAVEPEAFDPPPKVRSAVLKIVRRPEPAVQAPSEARFFEVVRAGFRAPRKQLHNALQQGVWQPPGGARAWLEACGIDPERRAATLTLEEWAALAGERERQGAPQPEGAAGVHDD